MSLETTGKIHPRREHGQTSQKKNKAENDGQRAIENEKATPDLIDHLKAAVIHE
jgi:hypothetical protein